VQTALARPHAWLWLEGKAFFSPAVWHQAHTGGLSSRLPGASRAPHDGRPVLQPDLPTLRTQLERAWWEPSPSHRILGWDGDVLEGGPISVVMHQSLVGREARCAKGKAGYKEGGKYEELKAS